MEIVTIRKAYITKKDIAIISEALSKKGTNLTNYLLDNGYSISYLHNAARFKYDVYPLISQMKRERIIK